MKHSLSLVIAAFALTSVVAGCIAGPSCGSLVDGEGTPSIVFTSVPAIGSTDELQGQVEHVIPAAYFVAVYIHVPGLGWWVKPEFAEPDTSINCNGSFSAAIVTGGDDANADEIAAFVLPSGFEAPLLGGSASLPQTLYTGAVAKVSVTR